jgi:hypothetical protein
MKRSTSYTITLPAAGAALLFAASAWADRPFGHHGPVSIDDVQAHATEVFAGIDSNGDLEISAEEFAAAELPNPGIPPGHGMHKGFEGRARGHRGRGFQEQHNSPDDPDAGQFDADIFAAMDTDGNGELSPDEFANRRDAQRIVMRARMFEHLDRDASGTLDTTEFPPHLSRLTEMDVDGNGELTRDELRTRQHPPHRHNG